MELTKETSLFKKDAIKTDVTAAAATATNYIDDVPNSSQTGMTLQPASNTANNYIQLDSDGLAVYKAGQLIASYGQSILLYHPGVSPLNAAVEITNSSARFTGQIQADSGYIGGWSIGTDTNQSLHNGAANVSPVPGEGKIILSTGVPGTTATGNLPILPNGKAWAFTAGNQFGVTTDGDLYASGAHLRGLSVGNYSDATTNHLYGNCVWTSPFAAYFNTDLGNTRRTYQGWTIEQNTGEYFDFDATNNWLVVDYSDYADKATTKVLQQNTGIIAPNTNFTISADLGTDCKVIFGGVEISGTDWQTADDGRKYATFTTTASTTSGTFEIWPVASENYIFKGNKFKLEKSDSYSSWTTLDEQIGKTGNAISQSAEATASYFLNFTSADGLKISNNADPSTTTTDYIQITSSGVKTVYDSTHFSNLTSDGLRIYSGNSTYPVASFITDATNNNASSVNFYKNGTNIPLVTINQSGATFNGDGTIGASGGIKLSTTNFTYSGSIGGSATGITNWRFTIGNQFGVTADGTLYTNAGKIGGCSIESGVLKIKNVNIDGTIKAEHLEIGDFSVTRTSSGVVVKIGDTSANVYDGARGADGIDVTSQYVTYIDGTNGVRVYSGSSTDAKKYYAQVNSGGLTVIKNSATVATFGDSIILGTSNRLIITTEGISFSKSYNWTPTGNSTFITGGSINITGTAPLYGIEVNSNADLGLKSGTYIKLYANSTNSATIYSSSCDFNVPVNVYGKITCTDCAVNNNLTVSNNFNVNDMYKISGNMVTIHDNLVVGGLIRPGTTKAYSCGSEKFLWTKVYAQSGSIDTSDRKEKDILGSIDFAKNLIMGLEPIQYMWKDGDHRRTRMGFVAQDVAKECKQLGLNLSLYTASYKSTDDQDYDEEHIAYYGEEVDDELLTWGLSYSQLIAPIVQVVQDQQKEIEQLKKDIAELKSK